MKTNNFYLFYLFVVLSLGLIENWKPHNILFIVCGVLLVIVNLKKAKEEEVE
ncbi:MAG TPA: hypothetical protein IAC41_02315 [Candidatus Merdenecus merdavium]|nr:hypothetical protein [Candidatus Merdenecus merdavium]